MRKDNCFGEFFKFNSASLFDSFVLSGKLSETMSKIIIDNTNGSEGALKRNSLRCNLVSSLNGRVRPLVFLLAPIEPSRINRLSKSIKRSHEFVLIYTYTHTHLSRSQPRKTLRSRSCVRF